MVGTGRKWPENDRKRSEIARNCWEQLEMVSEVVRADQKRSVGREMVGKRSEMVGNGRKWSEMVGNGQKWSEMVGNGRKQSATIRNSWKRVGNGREMVGNGRKRPGNGRKQLETVGNGQ